MIYGLPAFAIVGLPDTAVNEANERVQAAIRSCGLLFPLKWNTGSLVPGICARQGPATTCRWRCAPVGRRDKSTRSGEWRNAKLTCDWGARGIPLPAHSHAWICAHYPCPARA